MPWPIIGAVAGKAAASSWLPSLIGAGGSLLGGLIGSSGQSSANKQNLKIAREQMDFQERMSGTAYQRATKDLDAAGLNRILALGNPASSPGGQTARMENIKTPLASGVSNAVNSAIGVRKATSEIANIEANTRATDENAKLTKTKNLIAVHGEEIASIGADIARTVRALIGDKTPAEIAALIKEQINKASGLLTDALEKFGNTGQGTAAAFDKLKNDISIYVNDSISGDYNPNARQIQPGDAPRSSRFTEDEYARKIKAYKTATGKAKATIYRWLENYRKAHP